MTEEHKKKIGLANSIALKGNKINENQRRALEDGSKKAHTPEANKKRVETRRKNDNYICKPETKEKIKVGLEKRFPNGRPVNSGSFKKGQIAPMKGRPNYKIRGNKNSAKRLTVRIKHSCHHQGISEKEWDGFITLNEYPLDFDNELKEKIRKRDNYRCQECFRQQDELRTKTNRKYKLSIHHIDYNKNNNIEENLISLCSGCHTQTNYSRENWTGYYKQKVMV